MNYQANIWIANSAPGLSPDYIFPYGCPSLEGGCIVSVCQPGLVGKIDGIVYNQTQDPGIYHWYLVRGSIIGPGLRNGLVSKQDGGDIFVHGTLFINPSHANIVKLLSGEENVVYMANCASIISSNMTKDMPAFINIVEGVNDKIICATIYGGMVQIRGDKVIGQIVHQINTKGNKAALGPNILADHFVADPPISPKSAAYQFSRDSDRCINPPNCAAALAGLTPGTPLGHGFASGYSGN
jgi:hypothetical protein